MRGHLRASLNAVALTACLGAALAAPGAASAAFPGKNGLIAFSRGEGAERDIYTVNADGTGLRNLGNRPGNDVGPAWSPNGKKIAFTSDRAGNRDVWVMNADGSNPRNLTADNPLTDAAPAFSPDGKRIVFSTSREGVDTDGRAIFVMDARGRNVRLLADTPQSDVSPAFSPDGKLVGFTAALFTLDPRETPFVVSADGSSLKMIAPEFFEGPERRLAWFEDFSPDGRQIAFRGVRSSELVADVYTVPWPRGQEAPTNLTAALADDSDGSAYSPDGRQIALRRDDGGIGAPGDIWAMGRDATNPRIVTSGADDDSAPAWQPIPQPHKLRRLKRNKRRGTGKLVVKVPAQGKVVIAGKGLARKRKRARAAGKVRMPAKPKGGVRKRLRKRGKARVRAKVTYTRTGSIPIKQRKRLRLVRR